MDLCIGFMMYAPESLYERVRYTWEIHWKIKLLISFLTNAKMGFCYCG